MSSEQSLNPELIEQTKQQIRTLVNEIAQLAKSDISPAEFYGEFLTRVVSALAAVGGIVWAMDDEGRLGLQYQINLQKSGLRDNEEGQRQHGQLLSRVMTGSEPVLVPPHSGIGEDDDEANNPTDYLLVLGPLKTDLETLGVVEIFQRPEAGISTQKGYLRFLMQMCDLAGDFLKSRQLRHFSDRQTLWSQLEDFTCLVHASLDPRQTAYMIANEGRRLIECDRVSVAIRHGRKCRIEAVSGQDLFDKRSNTVRLLGELATKVVETGDPIWYTGDTSAMAPQVEDAVQEYVDDSHSKTVAVLPLSRPGLREEEQDPDKPEEPDEPIGALIVEQIEDSRIAETMLQRVDVVAKHSSTALSNAMEHQNLFLMPVWRALGNTRWIFQARTLPKTISISLAVLAVILALVFVPWNFELKAGGSLEPVNRSEVFAKVDGVVKSVPVSHGEQVQKGKVLVELRSTDLRVQLRQYRGDLSATDKEISAKQRQLKHGRMSREDKSRITGELQALQEKRRSLKTQLALLEDKEKDLQVTSPRDGQVVTWDLQNLLDGRPVQRGQVLMQVADTQGPWQLELQMPEDSMGYIVRAQRAKEKEGEGPDLPVTFILATDPGIEFEGKIKEIHYSAEVRGEEGNTVLIKVEIADSVDRDLFPDLRPGTEVTAKVYCGKRSIGYVLLYKAFAFVQSRIIFPW
ncbi:MAG: HlyD family efflux transporter periplasmic adaptor subunit [Planctomycetota bacterium]|nr:HlyD family efflux transporter periplasmic adaptor subunit [Planctomycetota bacterium]